MGGMIGIFICIAVVVVIIAIVGAKQEAERRKRLAAWAAQYGLGFDASNDRGFRDRYPHFKALRAGEKNRFAHNVMRGARGERGVVCFDYHYQTTSTDSKGNTTTHTYRFSGVIVESRLPLRDLSIAPEGFFDKVGEFFGFDDIDFESAEFSRKFKVHSPDRRWAYDVIHPATMEYMLQRPRYTLEIAGGDVILTDGKRWDEPGFDAALAYVEGFLDLIPPGVLQELRHGT